MRGQSKRAVSPGLRRPLLWTEAADTHLESLYSLSGLTRGGFRFRPIDSPARFPSPPPSPCERHAGLNRRRRRHRETRVDAPGLSRRSKPRSRHSYDSNSTSSSRVCRLYTRSRDSSRDKNRRRGMQSTDSSPYARQKQHRLGPVKQSHGRLKSGPEALTVKEQIVQIVAILVIAVVVASVGFSVIGWISDLFKPYCTPRQTHDCVPCPEHGICTEQELHCLAGYKKKGRDCVPDRNIDQNAAKLVKFIENYVCTKHSQAICDGVGSVWIPRSEVVETVREAWLDKQFDVDDETLPLVEERAFKHSKELLSVRQSAGSEEYQCPGELVHRYKPYSCRFREWAWRNILYLLAAIPLVSFGLSIVSKLVRRRRVLTKALKLYERVCEELEDKALNADDKDNMSWVVASRLRDHLLSVRERKNGVLWNEVERLVNEDSRIDQYPKLIKGEMKTVWEWQVEGALRSPALRRRGQQRVRFVASPSPLQKTDASPHTRRTAFASSS